MGVVIILQDSIIHDYVARFKGLFHVVYLKFRPFHTCYLINLPLPVATFDAAICYNTYGLQIFRILFNRP